MSDSKPKPIIIIKTGTMKRREIARAEKEGVCIIESDDPASVRLLDMPMQMASLDAVAAASIKLMRAVIDTRGATLDRENFVTFFVKALLDHKPPQPVEPVRK